MELEQNIRTDTDVLRWALHPSLCSCDAFADLSHICGVCQAKQKEANQDSQFVMAVSIKDEDGNIDLGTIAESEFRTVFNTKASGSFSFFQPSFTIGFIGAR